MSAQKRSNGKWLRRIAAMSALSAAAGVASSCSANKEPAKGQLMLAIQTDMALPKDVDQVQLQVSVYGNLLFGNTYPVGAGNLLIPATFALVAGKDPSTPVTIRLIARQNNKPRMLREVVTTVPSDRTAMLRLPVQWLCDGTAKQTGESVESTCPNGQSCLAGSCVVNEVESTKLPAFRSEQVFGGGTGSGDGACFDTVACFGKGYAVPVTLEGCTIDEPAGDFSVGLVKPPGTDGICGPNACIVPLDPDDDGGWQEQGGKIALPKAVCETLRTHEVRSVAVTTACAAKTADMPTCGAWSAVKTDPGTTDAGAPAEAGLEDATDQADAEPDDGDSAPDAEECGVGAMRCDGVCVSISSDPNHCGDCGRACAQTETCNDGQCTGPDVADAGMACAAFTIDTSQCLPVAVGGAPPTCTDGLVCAVLASEGRAACQTASTQDPSHQQNWPCNTQEDCADGTYCTGLDGFCASYCCSTDDCVKFGSGLMCTAIRVGNADTGGTIGVCQ